MDAVDEPWLGWDPCAVGNAVGAGGAVGGAFGDGKEFLARTSPGDVLRGGDDVLQKRVLDPPVACLGLSLIHTLERTRLY